MGVIKSSLELKVKVLPARFFKTLTVEAFTLLPQIMPTAIKSYELIQGDGGPGSITHTIFHEGASITYLKHRIDAIDRDNLHVKYAVIEGSLLGDKHESIHYDAKFEDSGDGGCIIKITIELHAKGKAQLTEGDIKAIKDQASAFYTLLE